MYLTLLSLPPKCYHYQVLCALLPVIFLPPESNACTLEYHPCPTPISLLNDCSCFSCPSSFQNTLSHCQKILPEQGSHQVIACLKSSKGSSQPQNNPHLGTQPPMIWLHTFFSYMHVLFLILPSSSQVTSQSTAPLSASPPLYPTFSQPFSSECYPIQSIDSYLSRICYVAATVLDPDSTQVSKADLVLALT